MIADNMPGLDLYQQFHEDMQFQVALVNLFTDITEFSVHAYRYFSRKALGAWATSFNQGVTYTDSKQ